MIKIIFSIDYEIHGNGNGDPLSLIIKPTERLIDLFNEFGAKLTVMADTAEIIKFKEFKEKNNDDDIYHYIQIVNQLQNLIKTNHDVQLHIHSSYLKAESIDGKWDQHWDEYNLAGLEYNRIYSIIKNGKNLLESLLKPVDSDYRCLAFRAANWSMNPSENIIKALTENGIIIDTSVFKGGNRKGIVNFDYSNSYSDLLPWPVNKTDICKKDSHGELFEIPIFSMQKSIWSFITLNRIHGTLLSRKNRIKQPGEPGSKKKNGISRIKNMLIQKYPWKMDFNQCSGNQLIKGLKFAEKKYEKIASDKPLVLIGHTKLFNKINEISLRPFLAYIAKHNDRYAFSTFRDFSKQLEEYR